MHQPNGVKICKQKLKDVLCGKIQANTTNKHLIPPKFIEYHMVEKTVAKEAQCAQVDTFDGRIQS